MSNCQKQNLLFLYADQLAISAVGAYGNDIIETPNLDQLAEEGSMIKKAYITQPPCTPARSSIITGLYPHKTGCIDNNIPLPDRELCLPEIADFRDYKTAHFGKWHLGDEVFAQHGFAEWVSIEDGYRGFYSDDRDKSKHSDYYHFLRDNGFKPDKKTDDGFQFFSRQFAARLPEQYSKPAFLAGEAKKFIKENKENPFILYLNFLEPHSPFFSCRDGQYSPAEIKLPESFYQEQVEGLPEKILEEQKITAAEGMDGIDLSCEEGWRRITANYWGLVSLVDTYVGKIIGYLEENNIRENTAIVFTSDHGDMMGSHRLITKRYMFEEGIRVPLIFDIPGLENQQNIMGPISQIDIMPTLLDILDRPIPDHLDGESLLSMINGTESAENLNDVFVQSYNDGYKTSGRPRVIVTPEDWKLIYRQNGEHQLYNLADDPFEMKNLYDEEEYKELINQLIERLLDCQQKFDDRAVEVSNH